MTVGWYLLNWLYQRELTPDKQKANQMKYTFKIHGLTVSIKQDEDAQSPRENEDNGLFIVASHRNFYVPEHGEKRCPNDPAELVERYEKTHWIFPLEAYIHGSVVLAFGREGNFPDRRWDVSQIGFVFAAKSEWRLSKSARKAAASKIAEWNTYLSGDVWGYVVEDADGEHLDSCWGFYGFEYCKQEAFSIAEHHHKKIIKTHLARVAAWIKNKVPLQCREALPVA